MSSTLEKRHNLDFVANKVEPVGSNIITNRYSFDFHVGPSTMRVIVYTNNEERVKEYLRMMKNDKRNILKLFKAGIIEFGTIYKGEYEPIKKPNEEDIKMLHNQMNLKKEPARENFTENVERKTYLHAIVIGVKGGGNYRLVLNHKDPTLDNNEIAEILRTLKEDPKLAKMYIEEGVIANVTFGESGTGKTIGTDEKSLEAFKYALKTCVGFRREGSEKYIKI